MHLPVRLAAVFLLALGGLLASGPTRPQSPGATSSRELSADTGDFDLTFGHKLCSALAEPSERATLLQQVAGADDVNNDGRPERAEACFGGTMMVPCTQFFDANGREVEITQQGHEWKDYGAFGEQRFRYDGKTFLYHSSDDGLSRPAYVSYVTPGNSELVVCDFSNRITAVRLTGDAPVCRAVERGDPLEVIVGSAPPTADVPAGYPGATIVRAHLSADIDNDGSDEVLAEMLYSSGANRGCDVTYFELLTPDRAQFADDAEASLIRQLQRKAACGAVNRFIRHSGRIYFESNVENQVGPAHAVRILEQGRVEDVCTFETKVHTTIKSVR